MRRMVVLGLVLGLLLVAGMAAADTPPNRWDIAKDPGVRDRWQLHLQAREAIDTSGDPEVHSLRDVLLLRARTMLEDNNAAQSPDVRLRFDLGEVYYGLRDYARAVAVLEPAIAAHPESPGATEALLILAYSFAYLDRPQEERRSYEGYLARETHEGRRATAVLNLAEVQMRLGHLDDAIAGYREALALAAALPGGYGQKDAVLAVWGLAVALDRDGDPVGAQEQARRADRMDPGFRIIERDPGVFFVPDYERLWYVALGRAEVAKQAPNAHDAAKVWARVEAHWRNYVDQADPRVPADARWLPLARAHLASARAARAAADKRAAKEKVPREEEQLIIEP